MAATCLASLLRRGICIRKSGSRWVLEGAAGQAEDGPRPRVVLVEHVEQFRGVALLPAGRVAADHGAGQPVGQGGLHRGLRR